MIRTYKVSCLKCGEFDHLTINEQTNTVIMYRKKINTPFLSFRFRGDNQWGFLCHCGNDNRVARDEKGDFDNLVAGDPISVKKIAASLKIPDIKQFKMEAA